MFIQTYWLALATLLTGTLVQAQSFFPNPVCFQGAPDGSSTKGARECGRFINTFCASVGANTPVNANRIGDNTARCYNLDSSRRCDFIAWNTYNQAVPPSEANCRTVLNNVINRCTDDYGGGARIAQTAYTFSVDANRGLCSWTVQPGN